MFKIPTFRLKLQPSSGESDKNWPIAAVTWYKIRHAGEQATHWDIQNKENANLS